MKIDIDGLKAMYPDYVRQKKPISLKDCPSPKKMVRLLRSGSSDKEATKIIDHISRCSLCFSEFEFLLEVFRKEKDFLQEVEKRLSESEGLGHGEKLRRRILGWRLEWRLALIFAGLLLAGFFVAKFLIFQPSEVYRSGSLTDIKLLEPTGDEVSRAALVFRWEKVSHTEYYILELFDQALAPVWNSDRITQEESIALPEELITALEVNRVYFWMVTAYLENGEKISSPLQKIKLKE
jgi:hypothetical protein